MKLSTPKDSSHLIVTTQIHVSALSKQTGASVPSSVATVLATEVFESKESKEQPD